MSSSSPKTDDKAVLQMIALAHKRLDMREMHVLEDRNLLTCIEGYITRSQPTKGVFTSRPGTSKPKSVTGSLASKVLIKMEKDSNGGPSSGRLKGQASKKSPATKTSELASTKKRLHFECIDVEAADGESTGQTPPRHEMVVPDQRKVRVIGRYPYVEARVVPNSVGKSFYECTGNPREHITRSYVFSELMDPTEVLIKCSQLECTRADLCCLKRNMDVTEKVMEVAVMYATLDQMKVFSGTSPWYMPCEFASKIKDGSMRLKTISDEWMDGIPFVTSMEQCTEIYIPIKDSKGWYLGVLDMIDIKVYVLDPTYKGVADEDRKTDLSNILHFMDNMFMGSEFFSMGHQVHVQSLPTLPLIWLPLGDSISSENSGLYVMKCMLLGEKFGWERDTTNNLKIGALMTLLYHPSNSHGPQLDREANVWFGSKNTIKQEAGIITISDQ